LSVISFFVYVIFSWIPVGLVFVVGLFLCDGDGDGIGWGKRVGIRGIGMEMGMGQK
jgi:hypothetical protein